MRFKRASFQKSAASLTESAHPVDVTAVHAADIISVNLQQVLLKVYSETKILKSNKRFWGDSTERGLSFGGSVPGKSWKFGSFKINIYAGHSDS